MSITNATRCVECHSPASSQTRVTIHSPLTIRLCHSRPARGFLLDLPLVFFRAESFQKSVCEDEVNQATFNRLALKTDTLEVEVLPELGGKISSLRRNGAELLQGPLKPYTLRTPTMRFEESDASGFDECLPSVSACEITGPSDTIQIPDHGEFWRLPCQVTYRNVDEVRLTTIGSVLPLRFDRKLKLQGETLQIDYRVENAGKVNTPYVWSAHPLFSVDPADVIVLPPSVRKVSVEASAHNRLGAKGSVYSWPVAELKGHGQINLSQVGRASDDTGDKLYTMAPTEAWAAIERKRAGLRVAVGFDVKSAPYLGLWLCYGGWPEGNGNRQQCVALEPCTAPGDSLALALEKGWARILTPGQSSSWTMTITVSELS
jgi:galactose mutarotase-like enzyme